ncbi:MAG TPA: ABC transporter ATP-binding protein [Pyrinomonadaceae bacterium]|nr:ABC transporter ATP-binding protein [Pyrinomonadaceae bacterium]
MPAAISINNVSKAYPAPFSVATLFGRPPRKPPVEALRDVSFDIHEGEIFGLIGPNGAGKTTLTKIIATLVQPTTGTVTVKGFDSVTESAAIRRVVGLAAAEERSFYWRLTLEQNLMFFARLYSIPPRNARARVAALLAQLDLESSARQRFGQLSTGNKQRMAIARALLNEPPILLLDEPTRSLDPLAAARMRTFIGSLAKRDPPVTILLTSHNLNEIEELCRRIAIISHGRIRELDTPDRIRTLHRPRERVRIVLDGISIQGAVDALAPRLPDVEISQDGPRTVVTFSREVGDDKLDRGLRAVLENGTRVVSCETERATLLEVLEAFEREEAVKGNGHL